MFLTSDGKTTLTKAKLSSDKIVVHTENWGRIQAKTDLSSFSGECKRQILLKSRAAAVEQTVPSPGKFLAKPHLEWTREG